jgi:hypothetical protein
MRPYTAILIIAILVLILVVICVQEKDVSECRARHSPIKHQPIKPPPILFQTQKHLDPLLGLSQITDNIWISGYQTSTKYDALHLWRFKTPIFYKKIR